MSGGVNKPAESFSLSSGELEPQSREWVPLDLEVWNFTELDYDGRQMSHDIDRDGGWTCESRGFGCKGIGYVSAGVARQGGVAR